MATRYREDFGFAGFIVYVRDFLRVCLTDRAVVISLVVCQLLMLLPMFTCYPMTEEAVYREQAVEMLDIATNTLSTYGSEMPRALLELTERERQHYADAVEAEYPSREYFAAMAAAKSVEYEMWRAGYYRGLSCANATPTPARPAPPARRRRRRQTACADRRGGSRQPSPPWVRRAGSCA